MLLSPASLTSSGRPVLQPGEVEKTLLDKVDLEFSSQGGLPGQLAPAYKDGYLILTNQRLIWIDSSSSPAVGRSCYLPVHSIQQVTRKHGISLAFSQRASLLLDVYAGPTGVPVVPSLASYTVIKQLKLRCPSNAIPSITQLLEETLKEPMPQPPALQTTSGAGKPIPASAAQTGTLWDAAVAASVNTSQAPPQTAIDQRLLQLMSEMGFPRNRASRALLATSNAGVQEAMDYLLAFGDTPGIDDPLDMPPAPPSSTPVSSTSYPLQPPAPLQNRDPSLRSDSSSSWTHVSSGSSSLRDNSDPAIGRVHIYSAALGLDARAYPGAASAAYANPLAGTGGGVGGPVTGSIGRDEYRPIGMIGVAGLVQRETQKTTAAGQTLQTAFQDLAALMKAASDMVALAERFRSAPVGSSTNDDSVMDKDMQLQLIALGITSPVTKETAGARYHMELARQLSDFLHDPLLSSGGMMTLPDVYCLFNRARGSELVSPDDLLTAAKLFPAAGLPLRLRSFPSGVIVVQGGQHTDEEVCSALAQAVAPTASSSSSSSAAGGISIGRTSASHSGVSSGVSGGDAGAGDVGRGVGVSAGIGASDAAKVLGVTVTIAKEHLLMAEQRGVLCRDDGPDGLLFFHNFFKEIVV